MPGRLTTPWTSYRFSTWSARSDIASLAAQIIARTAKRHRLPEPAPTSDDIDRLKLYHWPGNIRELQNVIERAVILSKGAHLRLDLALPPRAEVATDVGARSPDHPDGEDRVLTDRECREFERANVMRALSASHVAMLSQPYSVASFGSARGARRPITPEIQPYGHVIRMPIAPSDNVCRESVDHLNQLLADTIHQQRHSPKRTAAWFLAEHLVGMSMTHAK